MRGNAQSLAGSWLGGVRGRVGSVSPLQFCSDSTCRRSSSRSSARAQARHRRPGMVLQGRAIRSWLTSLRAAISGRSPETVRPLGSHPVMWLSLRKILTEIGASHVALSQFPVP